MRGTVDASWCGINPPKTLGSTAYLLSGVSHTTRLLVQHLVPTPRDWSGVGPLGTHWHQSARRHWV